MTFLTDLIFSLNVVALVYRQFVLVYSMLHLSAIYVAERVGRGVEGDDAVPVEELAVLGHDVGAHQLDVLRVVRLRGPDLGRAHLRILYIVKGIRERVRER